MDATNSTILKGYKIKEESWDECETQGIPFVEIHIKEECSQNYDEKLTLVQEEGDTEERNDEYILENTKNSILNNWDYNSKKNGSVNVEEHVVTMAKNELYRSQQNQSKGPDMKNTCVSEGKNSISQEELYCHVCGKFYSTRKKLNDHHLTHRIRKFECGKCKKCFNLKCELRKHIKVHNDLKTFKCDICGKMFKTKWSLSDHKLRHTGIKNLKCQLCGKSFLRNGELTRHHLVHIKKYKCDDCGKHLSTKRDLNQHVLEHEVKWIALTKLSELSYTNTHITGKRKMISDQNNEAPSFVKVYIKEEPVETNSQHAYIKEKSQTGDKTVCLDGNIVYNAEYKIKSESPSSVEKSTFSEDDQIKGENYKKEFSHHKVFYSLARDRDCNTHEEKRSILQKDNISFPRKDYIENGKAIYENYSTKANMDNHIIFDGRENIFYCQECHKSFPTNIKFKKHILIHTDIKKFECDVCNKHFRLKSILYKHIVLHEDTKGFECNECGRCFKQRCSLNQHKIEHQGIKKFKCTLCDSNFFKKSNLKRHYVKHAGIKNFKCDECGKCFAWKDGLNQHILTHLGIKNFKCDICGKYFGQSSTLRYHKVTHTGIKKYQCMKCEKSFMYKGKFEMHMYEHI